jgi:hypothetical protein
MLYAKILPVAKYIVQTTPFDSSTTNCRWMTAVATPYEPGEDTTSFSVTFYEPIDSPDPAVTLPIGMRAVFSMPVVMTEAELATWKDDDKVVLDLIAAKIGTVVQSYRRLRKGAGVGV